MIGGHEDFMVPPRIRGSTWAAVTAVGPPPESVRGSTWAAVKLICSDCSQTAPPPNQRFNLGCSEVDLQWLQSDPPHTLHVCNFQILNINILKITKLESVGGGRVNSQQWEGRWSTVRWSTINSQQWGDQQSTLLTVDPGGINSQQWEGQWSTVRQSTINSQQWEGQWSTVRRSTINSQQWGTCWVQNFEWKMFILKIFKVQMFAK